MNNIEAGKLFLPFLEHPYYRKHGGYVVSDPDGTHIGVVGRNTGTTHIIENLLLCAGEHFDVSLTVSSLDIHTPSNNPPEVVAILKDMNGDEYTIILIHTYIY